MLGLHSSQGDIAGGSKLIEKTLLKPRRQTLSGPVGGRGSEARMIKLTAANCFFLVILFSKKLKKLLKNL